MNDKIQFILSRRSCRSFSDKKVSKEDLESILECALNAPSGMNRQTWSFVAVTDKAKIQELARAVAKALGRGNDYDFYKPDVFIITTNAKDSAFREVDNACAMQNIYLAATALGLGAVWINQLKDCYDDAEVRKLLKEFGVPDNHGVYGCAAIGYPDTSSSLRKKEITASAKIIG